MSNLNIITDNIKIENNFAFSIYNHQSNLIQYDHETKKYNAKSEFSSYTIRTDLKVPKVGLMLIGWGGNNGSTLTASIIANRKFLSWKTRKGLQKANYFGSLILSSTTKIGVNELGEDVFVPLNSLLPMLNPNDLIIGGWDINSMNLADAMDRAGVLEPDLKIQLYNEMKTYKPLPSIYYKDFIAKNQETRADNLIKTNNKKEQLEILRNDIKNFKILNKLDKVIVLWTANTERFSELIEGVNDNGQNLLKSINENHNEISPSTIFAVASILEECSFINGSPQNTFVPGVIDLALKNNVFIGGDDFKSGQTKLKSVLVDFFVSAGIKPISITSYNHLGNNDGLNLDSPNQFKSKEISKRNVVDDMVESNKILYEENEKPDHVIVIKYVPAVGDNKRALDEYENEIFMGGRNTISIHNTCEDSLLASPLILDLVLLTEFIERVKIKRENKDLYESLHPVLALLSYMLKAPITCNGYKPVNSLFKQRTCIENFLKACIGIKSSDEFSINKFLNKL